MLELIDTKARVEFEADGGIFIMRGLTEREKIIVRAKTRKIAQDEGLSDDDDLVIELMTIEMLKYSLVGWKNVSIEWGDIEDNINSIPSGTLYKLFLKLYEICNLTDNDKKK